MSPRKAPDLPTRDSQVASPLSARSCQTLGLVVKADERNVSMTLRHHSS